jgi:hypothetical protein
MRTHARALAAIAALLLAVSSHCEPTTKIVRVGDAAVDGTFIQPFTNKWKLVGKGADGSVVEMGVWLDRAALDEIDGRKVIKRQQLWLHDQGAEGYLNIFDAKTMAPIVSQYVNAGGLYRRIEFNPAGTTVRYQMSPSPDPHADQPRIPASAKMVAGEIKTAEPWFDFNTGMFGLLIAAFPLKQGYSARFPVFKSYAPAAEPDWVDFEVTGKESVPAGPGKSVEAWRVVVHSPATQETMIIHMTREAPYIIRLQQAWMDRDWTFEMM